MAAWDKVFEASASGDAVLLDEVLRQMDISERTSALEGKKTHLTKRGWTIYKCTPLIVATVNGNLDCVKVLLKYKGDIESRCDGCGSYHSYTPLLIAAFNGYFDVLSCLVESRANVNKCTDDIKCTPLMIASRNGHVNSVALLLRHGADIDLKDKNGRTALHYAAEKDLDSCEVLSCLVENGADVNKGTDDINCTPLMIASRNGNVKNVALLIRHGAVIELQDKFGRTALYCAAENDRESCEVLSCLLENGADVNKGANDNCTPLMIASRNGNVNNVACLIRHGADIDLQDKFGRTALYCAAENDRDSCEVLSCLLENGADVNKGRDNNCTPLIKASITGCVNNVACLIRHGADIDLQGKFGRTALHYAVENYHGSCEVLSCLLENGADVNKGTDEFNFTPLMIASRDSNVNVVALLIRHGADMDLQDKYGRTALHCAAEKDLDSCEVLSCLVENGADVNKGTGDINCTPLMIASRKGLVNNVACLISHGADIDLQDKYHGNTALHYAVENYHGSCEVLSCLVENGADVNKGTDDINCTPLMIASRKGQVNVVALLIMHGANIDRQDKCGNTALHHAVIGDSPDVVHNLLFLGASQLYNNDWLTPLLLASNERKVLMVEDLINRPECTKKQRIDALELLGASVAVSAYPEGAFQHMKRGMEERFQDPSNPLPKQLMELDEAYQNRKESETCEELSLIEGDTHAVRMEGFVMRERILGPDNRALIRPMHFLARKLELSASKSEYDSCIGLYRHLIEIAQRCNEDAATMISNFQSLIHVLYRRQYDFPPSQKVILEVLEQTIFVFEKLRGKLKEKFKVVFLHKDQRFEYPVLDSLLLLLQYLTKDELCEEDKNSSGSTLLQKLCSMNLNDSDGNTLLHLAAGKIPGGGFYSESFSRDFPCIKVVKLLLNVGRSNVNAINNKGDTPLHRAATLDLQDHLITDMMQTLLDGGAHHDFTNNDGKTAMDLAINVEAYNFLSEKKRLSELTCISARVVKKFGLPYLGVVPKTLEKFISMH